MNQLSPESTTVWWAPLGSENRMMTQIFTNGLSQIKDNQAK
ncbi:hypothetical protein D082_12150 [Synechocystis sp. PCC 6714]|nr:hypothetical protein D082_12150 [Synechocystis sp. PCC 6714]